MSLSIVCSQCGLQIDPVLSAECPHCSFTLHKAPETNTTTVPKAVFVWLSSVGVLFVLQLLGTIGFIGLNWYQTGQRPSFTIDTPLALVTLAATLVAHIITLGLAWWVVTSFGRRPFFETLGWKWHPQFKSVHAVALALMMLALAVLFERVLPHAKTDFQRLLELSLSVRIFIVILAVGTAPIVEEVVYRGLLYGSIEKATSWKLAAAIVTVLFAVVHVPQYWGSPAAIAAILSLSLTLTLLRAFTGQLLPCVATHLIFNGIQAIVLLASPPGADLAPSTSATILSYLPLLSGAIK